MLQHDTWTIDKFIEYDKNPRINDHAVEKTARAIKEFGFRVPVIVTKNGNVIDGHLRLKAARKLGINEIPVVFADDLTPVQLKAFRLSVNRLAELAGWDDGMLADELDELKAMDFDVDLIGFDDFNFKEEKEIENIEDVSEELPGAMALKIDMAFPSKLPWNMPELRSDMLAEIPPNLKTWAGPDATPDDGESWYMWNWRTDSLRGSPKNRLMIGFYTDDYRFEPVWQQPDIYVSKMLNLGVRIALTPNFSMWGGEADAVHLWACYRSRWIGRYMQEAGIAVIPDVNWSSLKSFEFCLLGIPENTPVLALQMQTFKGDYEINEEVEGIKIMLNKLKPQSLLIYGHKQAKLIMSKIKFEGVVHYLGNRTEYRREVINRKEL
jgi:hypothetical protein